MNHNMIRGAQSDFSLRDTLDLAHSNHFLPQMILVAPDRAIPSPDRLVLTNHDIFGDFIEESTAQPRISNCS